VLAPARGYVPVSGARPDGHSPRVLGKPFNSRCSRFYLNRFASPDTIIPDPTNPQSLNRYSYVKNNPLKYTDPTGHFSEDEINRYLEHQLGVTEKSERETIINRWKDDDDWWDIIGPEGATYGDVFDGTKLSLGGPGNRVQGRFNHDYEHDTFIFDGVEAIFESPVSPPSGSTISAWELREFNSLIEFHDTAVDIIWARNFDDKGLVYQGGTGQAKNGAHINWDSAGGIVGHSAATLVAGIGSISALVAPEPTMLTKALAVAGFAYTGYELYQVRQSVNEFDRSVDAERRKSLLVNN